MYKMIENLKMSKILNALKVINTRILLHCAAVIVATLMVSWLEIKPYGVLFLILLVLWVYKTRCAASIQIIPPPELNTKFHNYCDKLLKLRKDRPSLFCAIITSVLGVLAVIGHVLSGSNVVVCGLILSALISTRYNFKILKVPNKERISWVDIAADNDDDEFLPEVNDSNLFVLQRASDQALVTATGSTVNSIIDDDDNKSDEIPSELLIPDSIPEIDENSESSDDELIPKIPGNNDNNRLLHSKNKHKNNEKLINDNNGSDDNEDKSLEFKKGYFKKDSSISTSSSDDESLSKGLNFNDYTVVDGNNQKSNQQIRHTGLASSKVKSILPNLVSGLMSSLQQGTTTITGAGIFKSASSSPTPSLDNTTEQFSDTSEESDFEILNTDDLNNP